MTKILIIFLCVQNFINMKIIYLDDKLINKLKSDFENEVAREYFMKWELSQSNMKIPALILISKEIHCISNIFLKRENMNLRYKRGYL